MPLIIIQVKILGNSATLALLTRDHLVESTLSSMNFYLPYLLLDYKILRQLEVQGESSVFRVNPSLEDKSVGITGCRHKVSYQCLIA
jgi:hypothetical protein